MFADTISSLSVLIEMSMFMSHGIWWIRTRRLRYRAKAAGLDFDTYPEAVEWQKHGFKFHWKRKDKCLDQEAAQEAHAADDGVRSGVESPRETSEVERRERGV